MQNLARTLTTKWADLPLRRKGLAVMATLVSTMFLPALFLYRLDAVRRHANDMVHHTLQVLTRLENLNSHHDEAHGRKTAYLLTGDPEALRSYDSAVQGLPEAFRQLRALIADNPSQVDRLRRLEHVSKRKIALLGELGNPAAATAELMTWLSVAQAEKDEIRRVIGEMKDEEGVLLDRRIARLEEVRRQSRGAILLLMFLGVAAATGGMILLTSSVVRRVESLHENAFRLVREEPLLPLPAGDDEVGRLGRALRQANDLLTSRRRELQEANKELEAFCYSVSHDLRAPLRSIDGFSLALLEDCEPVLDSTSKECLMRVRGATQRMGRLIDDLLTLSRVTRAEMDRQPVDLSALAQSIVDDLRRSQPDREVEFSIAPGLTAHGDPSLLRSVLENLLGNAWKFTARHPRARIEFGSSRENGKPVFYVRDDGAGFDMTYSSKLFGAFQRLHSASEFDGAGIGLASTQRVIHRHGGRIWAEGAVEQGATFYFEL